MNASTTKNDNNKLVIQLLIDEYQIIFATIFFIFHRFTSLFFLSQGFKRIGGDLTLLKKDYQ